MHLTWNDATQAAAEPDYVHAWTAPPGDLESVAHLDTLFDTIHLLGTYEDIIENYEGAGWTRSVNIFGLPYDWRFGLTQSESHWSNATGVIETAVNKTGEKAVLLGHSMGGFYIHNFLTRVTTPEWRAKYIDSAILIAPSLAGAGPAFAALWTRMFPFMSELGSFDALEWIGGLDIHMPNLEIYADIVIYRGPNGEVRTGKDVRDLLIEKGKISGGSAKLFDSQIQFFQQAPAPVDVPVSIVYNSQLPTTIGIDQRSGTDEFIEGKGDLYVNREGLDWVCTHWKGPTVVDRWDLHSDDIVTTNHGTMIENSEVLDWILNRAIDPSWQNRL
jgi:lecithin-cholesterol acyltransferase